MTREHTPLPWIDLSGEQNQDKYVEIKIRDYERARVCVEACDSYDEPSEVPTRAAVEAVKCALRQVIARGGYPGEECSRALALLEARDAE